MLWSKRSTAPSKIVSELVKGERTLSELTDAVEISKPAVLKHLKALEEEGVVNSRKAKRENAMVKIYSLEDYTSLTSTSARGYVISFAANTSLDLRYPLVGQVPQREFREEITNYLEAVSKIEIAPLSIVVFGSVARGEATRKSDIDAVFLTEEWSEASKNKIYEKLSSAAIEEGDIERSLNPHFRSYGTLEGDEDLMKEVRSDGILIYTTKRDDPTWFHLKKYKSI